MLIFGLVVNFGHFHVLLFLHHLITNQLLPQFEPVFVFIWIFLLELQYMYFSISDLSDMHTI